MDMMGMTSYSFAARDALVRLQQTFARLSQRTRLRRQSSQHPRNGAVGGHLSGDQTPDPRLARTGHDLVHRLRWANADRSEGPSDGHPSRSTLVERTVMNTLRTMFEATEATTAPSTKR